VYDYTCLAPLLTALTSVVNAVTFVSATDDLHMQLHSVSMHC
jgi:hypothetical protein